MTQVSASLVKDLREKTGAGMMDCKNALAAAGDFDGAVKLLREKGLAKAAKKVSRVAAEGLIGIKIAGAEAVLVEVNCETDFVARNEDFKALVEDLAEAALKYQILPTQDKANLDGALLNDLTLPSGEKIESAINEKIATIGEKIAIRRFAKLSGGSLYGEYLHGQGSLGVLVQINLDKSEGASIPQIKQLARDLAMHVAASSPSFIEFKDIPESFRQSEREIFEKQVLAEGKPANMVDKIVDGKIAKHLKEQCLLEQPFVKNPDQTITELLNEAKANTGITATVSRMVRFKVGEGIDKAKDDFAEEVKKMTA